MTQGKQLFILKEVYLQMLFLKITQGKQLFILK